MIRNRTRLLCFLIVVLMLVGMLVSCDEDMSNSGFTGDNLGFNSPIVGDGSADGSSGGSMDLATENDPNAKIVWTGNADIETTVWNDTINDIIGLSNEYGVQVMSSSSRDGDDYWYSSKSHSYAGRSMTYELRVPSEKFGEFFDSLGDVNGRLMSSSKSRADMTGVYKDNARQIELLEAEYEYLKGLLDQAADVTEMLSVRDRMTDVLYDLERLNAKNDSIDYDAVWSKVTLSVTEVIVYQEDDSPFFIRMGAAFVSSWADFVGVIETAIIFIIHVLPYGIVLAIIIFIVGTVSNNRKRKSQTSKYGGDKMMTPTGTRNTLVSDTCAMEDANENKMNGEVDGDAERDQI